MLTVLRQRNFALLWLGNSISMLGNWILIVALPFYVYQRTGSALATGATFIVETLPTLFFGSLAGVFVDRWDRRWTLIIANSLSALVLLPLIFVQSPGGLWLVYIVAFSEAVIAQFFNPAFSALVPNLVTSDQLMAANSANSFGQELTRLLGPTLGGVILGLFGLTTVILVDSCSFLFCALTALLIALPREKTRANFAISQTDIEEKTHMWQEWIAGLRLVRKKRIIVALFIVTSISMVGEGFGRVVFVPFIKEILHGNALALGWILTVQGIGGISGSLINARLHKIMSSTSIIACSGMLLGLLNLIAVSFPTLPVLLCIYLFGGAPVILFFIGLSIMLQQSVPDAYRGRIFGAYNTTITILLLLGMLLSSALTAPLGPRFTLALMGAFYFLAGAIAPFLLTNSANLLGPLKEWTKSLILFQCQFWNRSRTFF